MDKISHWLPFWENLKTHKVFRITMFMIDSLTHWSIEVIITFKAFYVQWSSVLQKLPCTLQMMRCLSWLEVGSSHPRHQPMAQIFPSKYALVPFKLTSSWRGLSFGPPFLWNRRVSCHSAYYKICQREHTLPVLPMSWAWHQGFLHLYFHFIFLMNS